MLKYLKHILLIKKDPRNLYNMFATNMVNRYDEHVSKQKTVSSENIQSMVRSQEWSVLRNTDDRYYNLLRTSQKNKEIQDRTIVDIHNVIVKYKP